MTRNSSRPSLHGGSVRLDRPNGQSFVAGEFGTGTDVEFMSAAVRGGLVQLPLNRVRLDFFGGQTTSGISRAARSRLLTRNTFAATRRPLRHARYLEQSQPLPHKLHVNQTSRFLAGRCTSADPSRKGNMVAGGLKYMSGLNRFQADLAVGQFSGVNRDATQNKGTGMAINLTGSYRLMDQVLLQGRYTYVGRTFLSPQSGIHAPNNLAAAGVSWQPRRWFTAALSGSTATTPGRAGQFNRYITATVNLTPDNALPARLYLSHAERHDAIEKLCVHVDHCDEKDSTAGTCSSTARASRRSGAAALNLQAGGNIRINESNTLEVSQSVGSRGLSAAWQPGRCRTCFAIVSALVAGWVTREAILRRFILRNIYQPSSNCRATTHCNSVTYGRKLVRRHCSRLHGLFFSSKRAERAINGPLAELNSYGAVYGRVYQDVNLNGRFDPGIDQPQANARVRVDGSRYVVSDASGNFRIESVARGEHSVYLDLLSVRADLTLLDNTQQLDHDRSIVM